jgi:hypothetical protein
MTDHNDTPPTVFDMAEISCLMIALSSLAPVVRQAAPAWSAEMRAAVSKAMGITGATPVGLNGQMNMWCNPFTVVTSHHDQNERS